jgi:cell division septal protein FtsQ
MFKSLRSRIFFLRKKRRFTSSQRRPLNRRKIRFKRKPKIDLCTKSLRVSRRKLKLALLVYRFSIILIGLGLGYLIFFSPLLRADEIVLKGDLRDEEEAIREKVYSLMDKKHLGFFPGNHYFFLKKSKITNTILEDFKIFESVEVKKNLFGKLEIGLKKKNSTVLICGQEDCISLDENGVALEKISFGDLSQFGSNLEIVYDESNSKIEIGKGLNNKEHLNFIKNVRNFINKNSKVEITELYTPLPSASEIKGKTAEKWLILFNTEIPLATNAEALRIILEKEIKPENRICLEYIDLRINNKVYYKLFDDCEVLKKQQKEKEKAEKNQKEK